MKMRKEAHVVVFLVLSIALVCLASMTARAQTVLLVTPDEAARPDSRAVIEDKTDGPVILIKSPENGTTLNGPFRLYIEIARKQGGSDIDMDSLAVKYLKLVPIDITGRVKGYIIGTKVDVPDAEFPEGSHRAQIMIKDTSGNISTKIFSVTVVNPE